MATYLGINLDKDEFWLIPIARASAEAPVPNPWEEMEDENGNPYFVNPKCGSRTEQTETSAPDVAMIHVRSSHAPQLPCLTSCPPLSDAGLESRAGDTPWISSILNLFIRPESAECRLGT